MIKMKRSDLVKKLMTEGFKEKTLVNMSDKQLFLLSSRILSESLTVSAKDVKNPTVQSFLNTNPSTNVRVTAESDVKEQDMTEEKPSSGLSKSKKSSVVKAAKKGKDIGKKGKGFEKVVKAAKKGGAKDPEAVAAAAMWKNIKRENIEDKDVIETCDWIESLVNENYHVVTTKGEITSMIKQKLNEQLDNNKLPLDSEDTVYADGVSKDQSIAQQIANDNARSKFAGKFPNQNFIKVIETAHRTEDGNFRYIVGLKIQDDQTQTSDNTENNDVTNPGIDNQTSDLQEDETTVLKQPVKQMPTWMKYDSVKGFQPEFDPTPVKTPTKTPVKKPNRIPDSPYNPGPGKNPNPKARL